MASSLMKGSVTLTDGKTLPFVSGARERIRAERQLGVKAADMKDGNIGEEYLVFLMFEALRRDGHFAEVSFDEFIDKHLSDYDVQTDPEPATPPAE